MPARRFCVWKGNKKEGFVPLQSVEGPTLELAVVSAMNREGIQGVPTRRHKSAMYFSRYGDKTLYLVFEEGDGPSLHMLKGAM